MWPSRAECFGVVRVDGRVCSLLWLAGVSLLNLLLRWPFLNLPMISDEGGYAYVARRWLDGRGTLYSDLWVSRPQGIFLAYGAIMRTIGAGVDDLRIGAWAVSALTGIVVWMIAAGLGGPRLARWSTLLFAVLSASPAIEGFTANSEVFMALPAAAAALLLLVGGDGRAWPLLGCGAMAALATIMKPSGIVMLPVALGFLWLASTDPIRVIARRGAIVLAGFALGLAPFLIHGYLVGWDNFVYAAVTYRINHQSSATNDPWHHTKAISVLLVRTWPLFLALAVPAVFTRWSRGEIVPRAIWPPRLVMTARLGIVPTTWVRPAFRREETGALLLRLWLLGCVAGIAMGGDWWYHYLIQAVAPISIWLALALGRARAAVRGPLRWKMEATLAALLLCSFAVLTAGDAKAMSLAIYGHPGYPDQPAVARYLQEHVPPETTIFVAFDQAALYYLADRPSAYRYLYDQELRALPNSQAALIRIIESPNRPMYIVGTRQTAPFPDRGLAFWDAVGRYYHLEDTVRGVPIYRANTVPPPSGPLTRDL